MDDKKLKIVEYILFIISILTILLAFSPIPKCKGEPIFYLILFIIQLLIIIPLQRFYNKSSRKSTNYFTRIGFVISLILLNLIMFADMFEEICYGWGGVIYPILAVIVIIIFWVIGVIRNNYKMKLPQTQQAGG